MLPLTTNRNQRLVDRYLAAKDFVIGEGYAKEIDWQSSISFDAVQETEFLRETGWVILSAGMRESVIRRIFPTLSGVFYDWQAANLISRYHRTCRLRALEVFRHAGKIDAIVDMAKTVTSRGFESVKDSIRLCGIEYLKTFKFVGSVTCFHLGKNLGLDLVKPDRHLVRLASAMKFETPLELCQLLSNVTGDKVSVIDLVLWRFATLRSDYIDLFKCTGHAIVRR